MPETRYNVDSNLARMGTDYSQLPETMVQTICNHRGFVGEYTAGECMMLLGALDTGAIRKNGTFDLHVLSSQAITIVYPSSRAGTDAHLDIHQSIKGVMFHASHPANLLTNLMRPVTASPPPMSSPSVTPPPRTNYFIWAPDPKQQANGKGPLLIQDGTYVEYYSQSAEYLKELSRNRGLRYVNKQWTSLLLSLCAQGKISKVGRFNIYVEGELDKEMDSVEKEIYIVYSRTKTTDPQVAWDKIGKSLIGVVRKLRLRRPPGESPYADLEITDDSQYDGEHPELDNSSVYGSEDG